ncbi:MAG: hypothetical protein IJ154_03745 [Bacteroidales bacterium]|nr:hypothetical protein [Bacteroidales bacterium]
MKLRKFNVMPALLLAGLTLGVISCGDKKEKEEAEKPMTSVEQKNKFEEAGLAVVNAINPEDFQYLVDEAKFVYNKYTGIGEEYDPSALLMFAFGCLQEITETQLTRTGQDAPVTSREGSLTVTTYNENFRKLYKFSNFTGHFTAGETAWVKSENKFSDLQLAFKDQNGADCTLTLSTDGKGVPVHFDTDKEFQMYNLDTATNTRQDYYQTTYSVVEVPQTLILSLKTGREEHVCLTLNPDLTEMQAEDFDLSKDSYSFTASLKVEKYVFNIEKIMYSPAKPAEISVKALVGNVPVASFSMKSSNMNADNTSLLAAKDVTLDVDLAGQIQIKGTCADALRFIGLIKEAEDNNSKESTFKSKINQANDLIDLGVYYDGGKLEQAKVKLEVFEDKAKGLWYCEPVIYFADGTAYSTFEAFFNETDFADLINAAQELVAKFGAMVNDSEKK